MMYVGVAFVNHQTHCCYYKTLNNLEVLLKNHTYVAISH